MIQPNHSSPHNPVLLIHGIFDTIRVFDPMTNHLAQLGWSVHRINLTPNMGFAKLEILAQQVADYIDQTFLPEQKIDLVGFSMGGLVTRYYLQRLGGIKRVQHYINISAPNKGTQVARIPPLPGCEQMRPNSEFLQDLNQDAAELLGQIQCTFLWTPYDMMIIPAESTSISVGKEIQLPVLFHAWMIKDSRSLDIITTALSEPIQVASIQQTSK